jgi:hypothetical protein
MAKGASLIALLIGGIIIADFLIHPAGTTAAGNAIVGIQKTAGNQLLGKAA